MTSQEELFSASDRLGLMLFLAAVAHLMVILGITFASPKAKSAPSGLDVTLVQTASRHPPTDTDLLAQANANGGGNTRHNLRLRSPFPISTLSKRRQNVPEATLSVVPVTPLRNQPRVLTGQSRIQIPEAPDTPRRQQRVSRRPPQAGVMNVAALNRERAQLSAEISRSWQEYEQRPREKFISARTRAYKYARYMDAWKTRVERIGNLHYPKTARTNNLSGKLLLDVAVNANGSVHSVQILRSSGSPVLDRAAIRIVRLAAPFAPFPPSIRRNTDVLHITRTWEFRSEKVVTRPPG